MSKTNTGTAGCSVGMFYLLYLLAMLSFGAWSVDEICMVGWGTHIPLWVAWVAGFFLGGITIPVAFVLLILSYVMRTPLFVH